MPRFDYYCPACDTTYPDLWVSTADVTKDRFCPNEDCGLVLDRLPAAPAFSVRGYNAKNGYSKKG